MRDAAIVAAVSGAVALAVNALRPEGIPLVARQPYETLVPCPEPGGTVTGIAADDEALRSSRSFLVDARSPNEYDRWHLPAAVNVPFDWLDPVPPGVLDGLARAVAASRATRVVVYGDGGRPDSGEHLGKELSGRGIRHVSFVRGGATALRGDAEQ
jgi:rhodanese-related sulfurtransferase